MNNFAVTLKEERTKNGLTQSELAEKLYVTRQAVSRWENGICLPSLDTICLLAELFQTTSDALIGLANDGVKLMTLSNAISLKKLTKRNIILTIACALLTVMLTASSVILSIELECQRTKLEQAAFTVKRASHDIITQSINSDIGDYSLESTIKWLILFYPDVPGTGVNVYFITPHDAPAEVFIHTDSAGNINDMILPDILIVGNTGTEADIYSVVYDDGKLILILSDRKSYDKSTAVSADETYTQFRQDIAAYKEAGCPAGEFRFTFSATN